MHVPEKTHPCIFHGTWGYAAPRGKSSRRMSSIPDSKVIILILKKFFFYSSWGK